ncbi:MAG: hypothetical protein ACXAD7_07010 [Candidatus Kariarchaeaceae archaeon]|jgi:tetratricopeptide (TPR) repeat protein
MKSIDDLSKIVHLIEEQKYEESLELIKNSVEFTSEGTLDYFRSIIEDLESKGNLKEALYFAIQGLKLSKHKQNKVQSLISKNEEEIAVALRNIGSLSSTRGELKNALMYYQKAVEFYDHIGSTWDVAEVLTSIGLIYREQLDFDQAIQNLHRALALFRELKSDTGIARILFALIIIYLYQNDRLMLIKYVGELDEFSDNVMNVDIKILNKLAKGLYMKFGVREVDQYIARGFLYEISVDSEIQHKVPVIAIINLIDILLARLPNADEDETLEEVFSLVNDIIDIATRKNSVALRVDGYLLLAMIHLIKFDFPNSYMYIQQASILSKNEGLTWLEQRAHVENTKLGDNLEYWNDMMEKEHSIEDRLELSGISSFINEMNIRSHIY